jgi:hypothetical protein
MANNPKCEDRLEALNCMNDSRLKIIKMLSEYSDFKRKVHSEESTESGNETKPYEEKYEWRERGEQVSNESE